jgi:hypothetical protein
MPAKPLTNTFASRKQSLALFCLGGVAAKTKASPQGNMRILFLCETAGHRYCGRRSPRRFGKHFVRRVEH